MRRFALALVLAGVTTAALAAPASAGLSSLRVHRDPDDSLSVLDIRAVATDASSKVIYTAVRSWDPFSSTDVEFPDSYFVFYLDTKRRGAADKLLYLGWDPNDGRFECDVFNRSGGFKGQRSASAASDGIGCYTPTKWYDIHKTVKFGVESYENRDFADRAPNDGRYIGL
jgi:hypothetical protein